MVKIQNVGALLAIKEINAAGGINGYKFELEVADVSNRTPDVVTSALLNLISTGVDVILGSNTIRDNFEIRRIAEEGIPYILMSESTQTKEYY